MPLAPPDGMQVKDVMTPGAETIRPDDTVKVAAERMRALDVGTLPVCDGTELVGMITDRDITIRAVAAGMDPNSTRIAEAMTPDVAYVFEDAPVDEAVELMRRHEVRRLPVVGRDKTLVGVVALADLARNAEQQHAAEALEGVSR